jgi:predicted ATPase
VVLIEFLRQKNALLILDNCEHLIGECARLADELLHQCPHLKILASSREALGIAGEASYRIPSLSHNEAVRLFAERAGAANSMFHLTEDNTSAVMRICARLDGIPLAIELAAARTRLLSPEQIAARLDDRFRLLIGGSRTALPRQQTLRALIDWSYDLLTDHEKRLLRMTSVFNGGWTLDALLAVSVDTEADTLERLEQLVNKSLVVVDENGAVIRYSLLETIRQYAREKLLDSGADDITAARGRHLAYYTALVAEINPRLYGPVLVDALDELELEQDNLRIALEWASDYDPLAMLQLTSNLTTFWGRRALATEGISWIQQSLDRVRYLSPGGPEASESLLRDKAKVLLGQGELLFELGKNSTALESVTASISLSRQLDDPQLLARALTMAAVIGGFLDRVSEARQWADEAFTLSRQGIYPYELALATGARLFQDIVTGHTVDSERLDEVIRVARLSRSPFILAMAISNVGRSEKFSGDYASALQHLDEACAFFTQMGDPYMQVSMRTETAHVYRLQGRYPEALSIYNETIRAFRDFNQLPAVAHVLECLAYVAVMQNQPDRAARLYGAAEMLRERLGSQMLSMERREYDESLVRLRIQLSEPALAHAWAQGRALDLDQVFATLL